MIRNSRLNWQKGFTLMELMIIVGILGILVAIAVPSYQRYIIATNEKAAMAKLMELSSLLENNKGQKGAYAGAFVTNLMATSSNNQIPDSGSARYNITIATVPAAGDFRQTYVLTATPTAVGGQNTGKCGTMTLDSFLIKSAEKAGVAVTDCWR